jgi:hypothetical protein
LYKPPFVEDKKIQEKLWKMRPDVEFNGYLLREFYVRLIEKYW